LKVGLAQRNLAAVSAPYLPTTEISEPPGQTTESPDGTDRFVIERLVGGGGMGAVYRARERRTGELVALKILARRTDVALERFGREAAVLAELAHPAIVRYLDHGITSRGEAYLAMEWLQGQTLAERLADGPIGVAAAAMLGRRVLSALAATHACGVVHRDIKPGNLFLPDGDPARVKVLDFGIAWRPHDDPMTITGKAIGTLPYMAPEQLCGTKVDGRADVFSLGCVLFECVAGQPLFCKADRQRDEVVLHGRLGDAPDGFVTLLESMLALDPERRPASADHLEAELASLGKAAQTSPPQMLLRSHEQRIHSVLAIAAPDLERAQASLDGAIRWVRRTDACVGIFTGAGPVNDQAIQAARCALKLKALLPDARLAIGTGRVMRATESSTEVIESAAGALAQAHPGNIIVDEASARLLEARFELVPESNGAMRLLFEKGLRDAPRTLLGREVPCVGRDREINSLVSLYKECVSEGAARVVLITAPAGGGKSRVEHEFCERLQSQAENFELLVARGDSVRASAPLGLLGMAVRASAGIAGGEPDPVQRKRLSARVARHIQGEDASRITLFLGELANIPFEDHESPALRAARQDPRLMADQMLAAWIDWLEAECKHRPVVLMLEDLHWGDMPSVQFVDAALRTLRQQPLMVLAAARPEIDQRFPKLWVDRHLQRITLPPLGGRSSRKMIANVLGDVAPDIVERIVARADGNPFYLEEILRAVATGGRVEDLPETVAGMVQARLDALGSDAKLILRAGSIFGQSFRAAGIKALVKEDLRDDVDRWLQIIAQKEVLYSRPAADTREFTFRHALLRETAYEMLAPKDRILGHRLAAEWLESVAEREAIVIADHFEKGQVPSRAIHWLHEAAQQALDSDDLGAVVERVERAVRLGAAGGQLCALRVLESQAQWWLGDYARAEAAAREAVACGDPDINLHASSALIYALGPQAKYDEIREILERLEGMTVSATGMTTWLDGIVNATAYLACAGDSGIRRRTLTLLESLDTTLDPMLVGRLHSLRAHVARSECRPAAVAEGFRLAAEHYEKLGRLREASESLANLGCQLGELGLHEEAEDCLRRVLAIAEKLSINYLLGGSKQMLIGTLAFLGRFDEARTMARQALSQTEASGDVRFQGYIALQLAIAELLAGEWAAAESAARTATETLRSVPTSLPLAQTILARALLRRAATFEALELARTAHEELKRLGEVDDGEATICLVFAECLVTVGNQTAAKAALQEAVDLLRQQADNLQERSWRKAFLTRIPDHHRIVTLATEWGLCAPRAD
jgi:tetratricopeptide (TPR) repeat protein